VPVVESFGIGSPFFEHPGEVAAELSGRGHSGLGVALGPRESCEVSPNGTGLHLERLSGFDQGPAEPGASGPGQGAMGGFPTGTPGGGHEAGEAGEVVRAREPVEGSDFGHDEHGGLGPDVGDREEELGLGGDVDVLFDALGHAPDPSLELVEEFQEAIDLKADFVGEREGIHPDTTLLAEEVGGGCSPPSACSEPGGLRGFSWQRGFPDRPQPALPRRESEICKNAHQRFPADLSPRPETSNLVS
jgi:hypothetical protein